MDRISCIWDIAKARYPTINHLPLSDALRNASRLVITYNTAAHVAQQVTLCQIYLIHHVVQPAAYVFHGDGS
jgi:hypothetical protein